MNRLAIKPISAAEFLPFGTGLRSSPSTDTIARRQMTVERQRNKRDTLQDLDIQRCDQLIDGLNFFGSDGVETISSVCPSVMTISSFSPRREIAAVGKEFSNMPGIVGTVDHAKDNNKNDSSKIDDKSPLVSVHKMKNSNNSNIGDECIPMKNQFITSQHVDATLPSEINFTESLFSPSNNVPRIHMEENMVADLATVATKSSGSNTQSNRTMMEWLEVSDCKTSSDNDEDYGEESQSLNHKSRFSNVLMDSHEITSHRNAISPLSPAFCTPKSSDYVRLYGHNGNHLNYSTYTSTGSNLSDCNSNNCGIEKANIHYTNNNINTRSNFNISSNSGHMKYECIEPFVVQDDMSDRQMVMRRVASYTYGCKPVHESVGDDRVDDEIITTNDCHHISWLHDDGVGNCYNKQIDDRGNSGRRKKQRKSGDRLARYCVEDDYSISGKYLSNTMEKSCIGNKERQSKGTVGRGTCFGGKRGPGKKGASSRAMSEQFVVLKQNNRLWCMQQQASTPTTLSSTSDGCVECDKFPCRIHCNREPTEMMCPSLTPQVSYAPSNQDLYYDRHTNYSVFVDNQREKSQKVKSDIGECKLKGWAGRSDDVDYRLKDIRTTYGYPGDCYSGWSICDSCPNIPMNKEYEQDSVRRNRSTVIRDNNRNYYVRAPRREDLRQVNSRIVTPQVDCAVQTEGTTLGLGGPFYLCSSLSNLSETELLGLCDQICKLQEETSNGSIHPVTIGSSPYGLDDSYSASADSICYPAYSTQPPCLKGSRSFLKSDQDNFELMSSNSTSDVSPKKPFISCHERLQSIHLAPFSDNSLAKIEEEGYNCLMSCCENAILKKLLDKGAENVANEKLHNTKASVNLITINNQFVIENLIVDKKVEEQSQDGKLNLCFGKGLLGSQQISGFIDEDEDDDAIKKYILNKNSFFNSKLGSAYNANNQLTTHCGLFNSSFRTFYDDTHANATSILGADNFISNCDISSMDLPIARCRNSTIDESRSCIGNGSTCGLINNVNDYWNNFEPCQNLNKFPNDRERLDGLMNNKIENKNQINSSNSLRPIECWHSSGTEEMKKKRQAGSIRRHRKHAYGYVDIQDKFNSVSSNKANNDEIGKTLGMKPECFESQFNGDDTQVEQIMEVVKQPQSRSMINSGKDGKGFRKTANVGRPRKQRSNFFCSCCHTKETPQWRYWEGSLVCNACYMRARKLKNCLLMSEQFFDRDRIGALNLDKNDSCYANDLVQSKHSQTTTISRIKGSIDFLNEHGKRKRDFNYPPTEERIAMESEESVIRIPSEGSNREADFCFGYMEKQKRGLIGRVNNTGKLKRGGRISGTLASTRCIMGKNSAPINDSSFTDACLSCIPLDANSMQESIAETKVKEGANTFTNFSESIIIPEDRRTMLEIMVDAFENGQLTNTNNQETMQYVIPTTDNIASFNPKDRNSNALCDSVVGSNESCGDVLEVTMKKNENAVSNTVVESRTGLLESNACSVYHNYEENLGNHVLPDHPSSKRGLALHDALTDDNNSAELSKFLETKAKSEHEHSEVISTFDGYSDTIEKGSYVDAMKTDLIVDTSLYYADNNDTLKDNIYVDKHDKRNDEV